MACGENPRRVYGGSSTAAPSTRMAQRGRLPPGLRPGARVHGPLGGLGEEAREEARGGRARRRCATCKLETLAEVLRGNILVQNHCYRADEMAVMLQVADEFGFSIRAFHHALEAYKLRDRLAGEARGGGHVGGLVGLQAGGVGRHPGERGAGVAGGRAGRHPLGLGAGHPAAEPGGGQGDVAGARVRHPHLRGGGAALGDAATPRG